MESFSFADFGRDDGCSSGLRWAASAFMRFQWSHMRHVQSKPSPAPGAEEAVTNGPVGSRHPQLIEREWGKTITSTIRKVSTFMVTREAARFRTSPFFPLSPRRGRPLELEVLQGGHAEDECGGCLRLGTRQMWGVCSRPGNRAKSLLDGAIPGESPQDAASLLNTLHLI